MREVIMKGGLLIVLGGIGLSGCFTASKMVPAEVSEELTNRSGYAVEWHSEEVDEATRSERIMQLLSDSLGLETVLQVALLNNRHLQSTYASLGIAQADLLQAGLYENPSLDVHVGYPVEEDHAPDLGISVAFNVLDLFQAPLRKAVARSMVEESMLEVSREVLSFTLDVQQAFYTYQAASQKEDLMKQIEALAKASFESSGMLREAGNIQEVALNNERAFYEQVRLEAAFAELAVIQARESLNQLMGLWGEAADAWDVGDRLPDVLDLPDGIEEAEQVAIEASLDLALAGQELETYAHQEGVVNATALLSHLKLGLDAEREGAWELGPGIGFPVPLFDQGQAMKLAIAAEIKQKQDAYYGLAVDVRSTTRTVRQEMITHYRIARHYRDVIVPLSSRISMGTQEQYNAMQIGVFQLMNARQQEIAAGKEYIEALRSYWLTRSTYEVLLRGVMSTGSGSSTQASPSSASLSRSSADH